MASMVSTITLFDFNEKSTLDSWYIQNDTVMGGKSSSDIKINDDGHAVFSGYVTTANNGGFAQVRHECDIKNIGAKKTVLIHLKGDGKNYQFRFKKSLQDRYSYIYEFKTSGEWETIEIPVDQMEPSFRGRKLNKENFNADTIQEIAILIGNKKKENFELVIDKIEMR